MDLTNTTNNNIFNLPDYVTQIFGYAGGVSVCVQEVPQFIKIIKTKSTGDLSLFGLFLRFFSGLLWITYGVMLFELPIIISNGFYLTLALIIIIYKIYYDKKDKEKKDDPVLENLQSVVDNTK